MNKIISYSYGLLLSIIIAFVSYFIAPFLPVGSVVIAIILGIIIGNIFVKSDKYEKGIKFSESNILAVAIALMGINLNFTLLKDIGLNTIILVIVSMILTIISAILIGKIFKFNNKFSLLIGIGSAVCGSSAIAATDKIIDAKKEEVGISIAIINFLGTIGVFLIPLLAGFLLSYTDINAGIFAGNTLQAVGQAVAAGFSISESSGQVATLVKMTRVLMLLPVTFILALLFAKKDVASVNGTKRPRIPLFVIGFTAFSLIPTFELLPEYIINIISNLSKYLLIIAMAAIGLKIKAKNILQDGKKALVIGSIVFLIQIIFSGSMIYALFN